MTNISSLLEGRRLPDLIPDRKQALRILEQYIYGREPLLTSPVTGTVTASEDCCGGAGTREQVCLSFSMDGHPVSFPMVLSSPKINCDRPPRLIVFLNFRPDIPDKYYPEEMLMRNNFAVARIFYREVTDDSDLPDGLGEHIDRSAPDATGKLGLWAFAASRALDYCLGLGRGYRSCGVIGHSRLGKTALLAGARDERFDFVASNCSGCSGTAITRDKIGEDVEAITRVFPFWFCPEYAKYAGREHELPFDQHLLLSLVAPRLLSVVSASEDSWADPESEFLACCAAGKAWEEMEKTGFVHPDRMALYEERFNEGSVGYYLREGAHALTVRDWEVHMSFWNKHLSRW